MLLAAPSEKLEIGVALPPFTPSILICAVTVGPPCVPLPGSGPAPAVCSGRRAAARTITTLAHAARTIRINKARSIMASSLLSLWYCRRLRNLSVELPDEPGSGPEGDAQALGPERVGQPGRVVQIDGSQPRLGIRVDREVCVGREQGGAGDAPGARKDVPRGGGHRLQRQLARDV